MGSSSVISYLSQLLRGQQLCFRMKLMFVGQENVGYDVRQAQSELHDRPYRTVANQ
jgi:hypothetical protein